MTTPTSDDRAAPADPRVAAAWRATSREDPPAALDAAILAAARREVSAGPRGQRAHMAMHARRHWWSLAAAATVAAIAVGVLQLTPPDQLGAPAPGRTAVTDMPTPATTAPTATPASASAARGPAATPVPSPVSTPAPSQAMNAPREDAAKRSATRERAAPRADTPTRRETPTVVMREPPSEPSRQQALATAPEPFPASPASGSAPRAAAETPAAAPTLAGGIAAREERRASPSSGAAPVGSAQMAGESAAVRDARRPSPPTDAATAGSAQAVDESAAPRRAAVAKIGGGGMADNRADDLRASERATLPVAEWVALIRRLRAEGKTADAARELAAFRLAHADHGRLLPPDLRDWRPPAP